VQLIVFGNNATCPEANGACSSYMLDIDSKKILLDIGNGSVAKIKQKVDPAALDVIVITHLHFDHFGDLFCLKYQLETRKAYGEDIHKITLLIPELPEWAYAELSTNDIFDIKYISGDTVFHIDAADIDISFFRVEHLIESYAVRVTYDNKIFVYSGDSGLCPNIKDAARNADLFLCESTFTADKSFERNHHLSGASAAQISVEAGVKTLVLTHYHLINKDLLLKEAKDIFPNTHISTIFDVYNI